MNCRIAVLDSALPGLPDESFSSSQQASPADVPQEPVPLEIASGESNPVELSHSDPISEEEYPKLPLVSNLELTSQEAALAGVGAEDFMHPTTHARLRTEFSPERSTTQMQQQPIVHVSPDAQQPEFEEFEEHTGCRIRSVDHMGTFIA